MNYKEEEFKKIKIVYEDEDLLALFKPKNLSVHGDEKTEEKTLSDWILENYPELKNVGEPIISNEKTEILRPGIVHRLDKDTSGIILVAKNQDFFLFLKNQFQERIIEKTYLAFVYGNVKFDKKNINTAIGRSKKDFRRWATNREIRGEEREAITEYEKILTAKKTFGEFSFLKVKPKTGRTHQIRVHLKYDNHPILADHLYAGALFKRENPEENLFFETQALFAWKIKFQKKDGDFLELEAQIPEEFAQAEKILRES